MLSSSPVQKDTRLSPLVSIFDKQERISDFRKFTETAEPLVKRVYIELWRMNIYDYNNYLNFLYHLKSFWYLQSIY